jgi:hypothetical protein
MSWVFAGDSRLSRRASPDCGLLLRRDWGSLCDLVTQDAVILDPVKAGLPPLPEVSLILHRAETQPGAAVARLTQILMDAIQLNLAGHVRDA